MTYHSFCPDCGRVIYNIRQYGPVTPFQYNKTFCVCHGKMTGVVQQPVTIFGLEDILGKEGAAKERERQKKDAARK